MKPNCNSWDESGFEAGGGPNTYHTLTCQPLTAQSNITSFNSSCIFLPKPRNFMGSSSSNLVSSKSSSSTKLSVGGSRLRRTKRKLSHIFCGVFTSKSTFQKLEDCPDVSSITCTKSITPNNAPQSSISESSSVFTSEAGETISIQDNGVSSERSSIIDEAFLEPSSLNVQTSTDLEPLPQQPAHESVSGNATSCQSTSLEEGPAVHLDDPEYSHNAVLGHTSSDLRSLSVVSDSLSRFQFPGDDDHAHVATTSSSGFLVSDSDQDLSSGDLLRLDLVSISNSLSGNIAEANSRESRRNSMRLFWDALSRRSLRRHSDYPTLVFATGFPDDLGSHDRWLLDFSDDFHYHGAGRDRDRDRDRHSFGARHHRRNERRWLLRSEVSETIDGLNDGGRQTALCASGLHLDGTCSCDSFFTTEESNSLASISRIVLLAEALFEVLDEIHNQSLSLSLSSLSLPAPETVVDAFPLKFHKKITDTENDSTDVRQCYICLTDYEEGDELRVLPCNHEYHVPCIDKWLKEVNRVCPVCRHDVCEGRGECSVSSPQES